MAKTVIISCSVFAPEIETLQARGIGADMEVEYLEQGLHVRPDNLRREIQNRVSQVQERAGDIRLVYGLCSNGTTDVIADKCRMSLPRCHDCISILMGSRKKYETIHAAHPDTLFLSRGWLEAGADPLSIIHNIYAPRMGVDKAVWGMNMELQNYSRIALILSGTDDLKEARARVRENAEFLDKEYVEIEGGLDILERLLAGEPPEDGRTGGDFIRLERGQAADMEWFL